MVSTAFAPVNYASMPQNKTGGSMAIVLQSFALDRWIAPATGLIDIASAVDGHIVARASSAGLDFAAMAKHARDVGGPGLRKLSFHQRADRLRALAAYIG